MNEQNIARVQEYLQQYNTSLPAQLSDEEREKLLHEALNNLEDHDISEIVSTTTTDLQHDFDQATIHRGQAQEVQGTEEIDKIRSALS